MGNKTIIKLTLVSLFLLQANLALAEPGSNVLDGVSDGLKKVGDAVGDTASGIGDTVKGIVSDEDAAKARTERDVMAEQTLARLFKEAPKSKEMFDKSFGHAVFDTRRFSILITTGGGGGVAVEQESGERTYMKMFSGGLNLGGGVEFFQLVFLFEDEKSFRKFVDKGWEAGASAAAVFGKDNLDANSRFVEGMKIYQLSETGIMLNLNVTGTKYWKHDDLNKSDA